MKPIKRKSKIDLRLEHVLERMEMEGRMDEMVSGIIRYKHNLNPFSDISLRYPDFNLHTDVGGIATFDCPAKYIKCLVTDTRVIRIEAAKALQMR